ncbi:chemotaxis protein MotA [Jatrophihabitans endophyticus]|uniref:Chemotaxis protein MotA n=1 Tax=Jatrophihabitans endophyticus TaxID=1206085 RepID=A0A1M5IH72_9ACTN|nr:flagellar motor protein [Jatrophihabitans endophyticus]SHG27270.1 chemotaxis protein MotA [Jatrophihabitans endophyticus]
MDPASIIGIGLALAAIVGSTIMEGGDIGAMFLIPPMILVFGGTIGAAVAGGLMADAKALPKSIIRAMTAKLPKPNDGVETIVKLADKARREGLLALEAEVADVEDPFLKRALEMAVDGTDADEVAEILGSEVDAKRAQDAAAAKIFQDMGGFAPTIGIIGTVLGLVHVLGDLGDPSTLGEKIASAFVATLWGVMTANVFWFPIANRIKRLSEAECEQMEVAIEGVLAIQAGNNPRVIERKLTAMMTITDAPQKDAA